MPPQVSAPASASRTRSRRGLRTGPGFVRGRARWPGSEDAATLESMTEPARPWVLHVDLDQFIAAVEVLRRPELAGKPVIVGGRGDPTERAVVSTASYEARAFGVGSGMPLRIAARKAPDAIILPVDAPAYTAASDEVMATLRDATGTTV